MGDFANCELCSDLDGASIEKLESATETHANRMKQMKETCKSQMQSIGATQQALQTTQGEMRNLHDTIETTIQQRDAVSEQMRLLEAKMNVNIHKMHEDLQGEVMKTLEDSIARSHISEKTMEERLLYRHLMEMYELNRTNSERMDAQLRNYQQDLLKREARNLEHETDNANMIQKLHKEMDELQEQGQRMQQERTQLTARLERIVKMNCEKALGVLDGGGGVAVDLTAARQSSPVMAEHTSADIIECVPSTEPVKVTELVLEVEPHAVSDKAPSTVADIEPSTVADIEPSIMADREPSTVTDIAALPNVVVEDSALTNADNCPTDTEDTFEDAVAELTITSHNKEDDSKPVYDTSSVDYWRKKFERDIQFTNPVTCPQPEAVSCTSASDGLKKMEDKFQNLENRQTEMLKFFTNIVDKLQHKSDERSEPPVATPEPSPAATPDATPTRLSPDHLKGTDVSIWMPERLKHSVEEKYTQAHIIDDESAPQKPLTPTKHHVGELCFDTEHDTPSSAANTTSPPSSVLRSLWQPPVPTESVFRPSSPLLVPSRSVDSQEVRKIVAPARGHQQRKQTAMPRTTVAVGRHGSATSNGQLDNGPKKKESKCARNIQQRSKMARARSSKDTTPNQRNFRSRTSAIQFVVTPPPAKWASPPSTRPVPRAATPPSDLSSIMKRVANHHHHQHQQQQNILSGPVPRSAPVPCAPPVPPQHGTPDLELTDGNHMPMKDLLDYLQDLQVINNTMQDSPRNATHQLSAPEARTAGGPDTSEMPPISEIGSASDLHDASEMHVYENSDKVQSATTNEGAWFQRLHANRRKTNRHTRNDKEKTLGRKATTETRRRTSFTTW